jgi:hypothetical protein
MSFTRLTTEALRDVAEAHRVCTRPVMHDVLDTVTGKRHLVASPCGATIASKCVACAHRNRVLRMQQCREGWHLETEPELSERDASSPHDPEEPAGARRIRSTRRRQDAGDLPRLPIDKRTVGATFTTPSGTTYRPSMFVTFTLPSYGAVRRDGTPLDPNTYDYRRAALDALHFPKLIDRVWQNLRRATGYQVQYFACVEAQRRLAPHLHAAIRGAIPRETLRTVARATYHQVWWPAHREPTYDQNLPLWTDDHGYVDPVTHHPLPTWDEALDSLDADDDARPEHVLRLGRQLDIQGIIASEGDADRRVVYLTKYLSKSFGSTLAEPDNLTDRQRQHLDRLHQEVRSLPCTSRCANWLRFGVQPVDASAGMLPGECPAKGHDRDHLGCGGRRVLVSRKWTGKTLDRHRADRAEVVRQTLLEAGVEVVTSRRLAADTLREDGRPRYEWKYFDPRRSTTPLYRQVLTRSISERLRWRREYEAAKAHAGRATRAGPATSPLRHPDNQPHSRGGAPVKGERSESRSDTKCP